jgi:hypothetical protein
MAAAAPILCIEKEKLLRAFVGAVSTCNRMHTAQVRALSAGEGFAFEEQIAEAATAREQAKYALLDHCLKHGC